MDSRIEILAKNIVNYSCNIKKGEKVLINCNGTAPIPLVKAIIKEVYKADAYPFVEIRTNSIERELLMGMTKEQAEMEATFGSAKMKEMDAFIGVRGEENGAELYDVPSEKLEIHNKYYQNPVHHEIRVPHTKWVVLRYPCPSMAQSAKMSMEAFEDYFFNVCNLDYSKMSKAMDSLVELMNKTDKVRITAKDTDISFSIKDIPAVKCAGECNIPDGEVYTAPVRESINGTISYNTPSEYDGFTFEQVKLTFENGKIVKAEANDTERINKIFDADEGARYVGEFAIGVNPYITKPMNNILFDEKIMGSIHFTPGNCYDDAPNGNKSSIHWDLVLIQTPEYGGGEIYFDDVLIRKDGKFVIPELMCLNPENLI
ncbi:MAG: aminopeptidase [Tyzzerella sp.]|uniref:Aminopeptidase n=1 Tax=Candidatus Fimicola merdigallinarum TaxID=2840819 RepID=A0A9D9DXP3_9FIRM|nr:aminopeptidase [Candidatus Fimicola merdigallinarum]